VETGGRETTGVRRLKWVDNVRMRLWVEGSVYVLGMETGVKVSTGES